MENIRALITERNVKTDYNLQKLFEQFEMMGILQSSLESMMISEKENDICKSESVKNLIV
jgi:hypothetical protein